MSYKSDSANSQMVVCDQYPVSGDVVLAAMGIYSNSLSKSLDLMKSFTSNRTGLEKSDVHYWPISAANQISM